MERYRMVLAAHEILSDPAKRQAYDSNGAGWNDCSENGAPMYRWSQPKETKWSGFDTNDSPFRNATWEDWEKWYQRDKARQEPVYISNGGFLLLVVTAILFGAFGQSMRVEDYSNMFQRQVDMAHDDASKYLRRRKHDSIGLGNKDERLEHFLKSRDPYGHGVTNPTEERYRQMFIEPETWTNTYLLGKGADRILIDSGEGKPSWLQCLKSILADEKASISHALMTHWHPDHVGGLADLRSVCPGVLIHKYPSPRRLDTIIANPIQDGQIFKVNGATLRAFHCPGHTTDHMGFILEEENSMFTGDNVLGHGTAVFEDLIVYLDSLNRMYAQFKGRAYPAHGEVIENGPDKITEYIAHRQEREAEILQTLKQDNREATPMELVQVIYKDVSAELHARAADGVLQVLRKLEREGNVVETKGAWHVIDKATL
ncbi:hypothetical protein ACLMJK_000216 [Lecanora helva]